MISPSLENIAKELRAAAGKGAYADVQRLVVAIGAAAAREAAAFPAGDVRIREIADWLNQLFEWTGIMLRTVRAGQAAELRRIPFLKTYLREQSLSNL